MKRIVALLLLLCLCALSGCGGETRAAILCMKEAEPAARAMCTEARALSYAAADSDMAALQQVESGACEFALVTREGLSALEAGKDFSPQRVGEVTLSVFYILSREGAYEKWTKNTRVIIVGERDGYGDILAQQVLSCALYGTVRYMDLGDAMEALSGKRADVVMGMMAPKEARAARALKRIKGLELLDMPESLLSVRLPDASMAEYTLSVGDRAASTYALMGALVRRADLEDGAVDAAADAARKAGLMADHAAVVLN